MRAKVARQLNRLSKALGLSRGDRKKLKQDWRKTPNRSLVELKTRVDRVETTIEVANDTAGS